MDLVVDVSAMWTVPAGDWLWAWLRWIYSRAMCKSSKPIALVLLRNVGMDVDYLPMAKSVAVTTWESAVTTCSIKLYWLLVVLYKGYDLCCFLVTRRSSSKFVRSGNKDGLKLLFRRCCCRNYDILKLSSLEFKI